jgi:hypothetical protein
MRFSPAGLEARPYGRQDACRYNSSPLCSEDEEPSQPTGTDDGPLIAGPFLPVSWPQRLSPLASISRPAGQGPKAYFATPGLGVGLRTISSMAIGESGDAFSGTTTFMLPWATVGFSQGREPVFEALRLKV